MQRRSCHFLAARPRKSDLLDRAKKNHAERAVLDIIGAMPDQDYWAMAGVMKGLGKAH
jgi:hypothetical protein